MNATNANKATQLSFEKRNYTTASDHSVPEGKYRVMVDHANISTVFIHDVEQRLYLPFQLSGDEKKPER